MNPFQLGYLIPHRAIKLSVRKSNLKLKKVTNNED
jgi:hypothetical protein